mgnify:CR=1 FL=1
MKYFIAADHAGIDIKSYVKELFEERGHEVIDLGPFSKDRVDYPDYASKVCKKVIENVSYNQRSENIWNKVGTTKRTLEFNLTIQSKCKDQTDYICHNRSYNCKFKCKQIRTSDSAVCKKILIISKSYPVKASITFEIRKTVNHTFDQWQCIKTEKQCHDRNCYQKKGHFSSTH